jgi:hypothetical protein
MTHDDRLAQILTAELQRAGSQLAANVVVTVVPHAHDGVAGAELDSFADPLAAVADVAGCGSIDDRRTSRGMLECVPPLSSFRCCPR